jgi:hypothetical protein
MIELVDDTRKELGTVSLYVKLINIIGSVFLSVGFFIALTSITLIFYRVFKVN